MSIQSLLRQLVIWGLTLGISKTLWGEIIYNFPNLTSNFMSGAKEYANTYSSYARAFSTHYGNAVAFTNHLSYPVGYDAMGGFPAIYTGVGLGTAFSNTRAMKAATNEQLTSGVIPKMLPTLGLSLNLGLGLTKKWDVRLGFLPVVNFALPTDIDGLKVRFKYGNARAKVTYNWLESSLFMPGISFAGYLAYTEGSLNISKENIGSLNYNYTFFDGLQNRNAVASFDYNLETAAKWRYLSAGGEARLWYDLLFFVPYIGWGLGLQGGRFTTSIGIAGDIQVTIPDFATTENDTGGIKIKESARAQSVLSRFLLGFEINLFIAKVAAEAQFDTNNRLAGIAVGSALSF